MKKKTTRLTIDDIGRMIHENFATKNDLDRLETNLAGMISKLPTRDDLERLLKLDKRVSRIENVLGDRLSEIEV